MRILLLGAGDPQVAFINLLHDHGHFVLLVSYETNPIARKYADEYFEVSTLDIEAVAKIAQTHSVDRIIAVCTDQALYTMAIVSEMLGLPCYLTKSQVEKCTKKNEMKDLLKCSSVKCADYQFVNDEKSAGSFECKLNYPLVVKPVDCNSSKGVQKVSSSVDLKHSINVAMTYSRSKKAIIEEYIEGREITIDGFVDKGRFILLMASELKKQSTSNTDFLIVGSETLLLSDEEFKKKIESICQRIVDEARVDTAPFIAQMVECKGELYVIEYSLRTGGGEKYRVIKESTTVDVLEQTMHLMVGETVRIEPQYDPNVFSTVFLYGNKGTIGMIYGLKELVQDDIISFYYIYKEPGFVIGDTIRGSGDRILGFTIKSGVKNEIEKKIAVACDKIKVLNSCGQNMIKVF